MTDESTDDTEQSPPSKERVESSLSATVREEYEEKFLEGDERVRALEDHTHHLVRDTTSQMTLNPEVGHGMEADVTVEVPDTFCFTCNEWVGLSGLDLTGTPRSKKDSYYLHGPPKEVESLRQKTRASVTELAAEIVDRHPSIDDPNQAAEFVAGEIEQLSGLLVARTDGGNARGVDTDR